MSRRRLLILVALMASGATTAPAQDGSSAPPATPTSSEKPAKRVWTNDDLTGPRESAAVSTPLDPNTKPANTGQKPAAPKNRNAQWYHDQIAKLQAQVPPLDGQIAELQAAIKGKPTGDAKTSQRPRGVKADDWSVELAQLQAKRDDVLSKISALQDEARHNGIPDSALP